MIPGLKIEFFEKYKAPGSYGTFNVNKDCQYYWLDGGNEIIVEFNTNNKRYHTLLNVALISFDFMKCLDCNGSHLWLESKLEEIIDILVKNKHCFFNN